MKRYIALAAAACIAGPAAAQSTTAPATAPAPPCIGPEFRTLDFWVGEWIAEDQQGKPIGINRITRDEYGDCVITEHFRMGDGSMVGHSPRWPHMRPIFFQPWGMLSALRW